MRAQGDLLQLFANPTNRAILSILALEPQYPRRLAELVGLTEDETSRRLRTFEKLGIAEAEWVNVGKTVRLYRLASARFTVEVTASGLTVAGADEEPLALGAVAERPPALHRFVGREGEIDRLRAALETRRAVCLHGIGGAGKTTLAAAFAGRTGAPVVWHTVSPGESGPVLLGRVGGNLRALDPARAPRLVGLRAAEDPMGLVAAVAESANALGAVVVLDRFESAADGAGDLVSEIAKRLTQASLLATSRTYPREFPRDAVTSFPLGGLSREDADALLSAVGVRATEETRDAIYGRTLGHPLSLVLLGLAAGGRPDASAEGLLAEAGIRDFLLSDVLPQLPDAERETLVALAVLRDPFLVEEAEAVTESRHVRDALLRLEARGIVQRAGELFAIHDLVRTFAAEATPDRKRVHARAAAALAATMEPAKVLEALHHHMEAGKPAEAARIVREEAERRTYRFIDLGLIERYREALQRLAGAAVLDPRHRAAVELELGTIATFAGEAETAAAHLEAAARLVPKRDAITTPLLIARARLHRMEGRREEAHRLCGEAAAAAEAAGDVQLLLEALVDRGFLAEEDSDTSALPFFERAVQVGRSGSDVRLVSVAMAGVARVSNRLGTERVDLVREAARLARLGGYLRGEASVYMTMTSSALGTGEFEKGFEHAERFIEVAERLGDPWLRACALTDVAFLRISQGDLDAAERAARECIAVSDSVRSDFFRLGGLLALADVEAARGRWREVVVILDEPVHQTDATGMWGGFVARGWRALARAHAMLGDGPRAMECEARAHAKGSARGPERHDVTTGEAT